MDRFEREATRRPTLRPSAERLEVRIALSALVSGPIASTAPPGAPIASPVVVQPLAPVTVPASTSTSSSATAASILNVQVVPLTAAQQQQLDLQFQTNALSPRVTQTQMLTRGDQVVGFVVRFSKPMDPTAAQDMRNYHAYQITQPNKYLARLLYQSDRPKAHSLGIRSATYVGSADAVVLMLSSTRRAAGAFRVELVNPAAPKGPALARLAVPDLADTQGHPLIGPTGTLGRPLAVPIMLRPGSRIRVDGLPPGKRPI